MAKRPLATVRPDLCSASSISPSTAGSSIVAGSRSGLRQAGDDERRLEARDRADAVVHERDGLALDVRAGRATPALSTRKPNAT